MFVSTTGYGVGPVRMQKVHPHDHPSTRSESLMRTLAKANGDVEGKAHLFYAKWSRSTMQAVVVVVHARLRFGPRRSPGQNAARVASP